MMKPKKNKTLQRRTFIRLSAMGTVAAGILPGMRLGAAGFLQDEKPATNIQDALAYPWNKNSMPGSFPGEVVSVYHGNSIVNNRPDGAAAYQMLERAMLELTGKRSLKSAWRCFVEPGDKIGLKVNPVAGKTLTTSPEVTEAIIRQLRIAGIPLSDIMIWDRREFQLYDAGFTAERFPGITIRGTEQRDSEGKFYNADGEVYGKSMIDPDWYYWARVEGKYDEATLPYMVNEGEYSYFTKIVTREVDKIINVPILKNAGSTVTLCMKNLAFGSISNTSRLHQKLWVETCAEVNAFPPLRDKVVLNVVDGLRGCYNGGPGANPQFFTDYKTMLVGTDPVAVDRIGYEIVLAKRLEEKIQKEEIPSSLNYMNLAEKLQLGIADRARIQLKKISL